MCHYQKPESLPRFSILARTFQTSRMDSWRHGGVMTKSVIFIGLCCIQPMWPQDQSVFAPTGPVTLTPASLSFNSQPVGTTKTATVKLTNNQATALTISSIAAGGDFAV